jgi:hypothetical protein
VSLRANPLDCHSILIDIPTLRARGVYLDSDNDPSCHVDADSDGTPDAIDNCSAAANASQLDSDSDGFGDQCDCDHDGDGLCDGDDLTILGASFGQSVPPAPAQLDQDESGYIDGRDFLRLGQGFGQPPGPSCENPQGTPCP